MIETVMKPSLKPAARVWPDGCSPVR